MTRARMTASVAGAPPALRMLAMLLAAIALAACAFAAPAVAHADSGTVYSCTVHPVYKHPVTGAIEDSGGASAAATGQAMVESCVAKQGMMEVTDAGECYLTIRLSLIDLTSGHTFQVQERGASGWSTPALGVTGTGSDANGTTNDVCIGLPSQTGIVRISMYVESMGRDVVFYAYADGLSAGTPAGFTPTIVTSASASGTAAAAPTAGNESTGSEESGESASAGTGAADASGEAADASADNAEGSKGDAAATDGEGSAASAASAGDGDGSATAAADLTDESGTSSAQGLSLSTAPETAAAASTEAIADSGEAPAGLFAIAATVVASGIVLMLVAALIVYVFRRNWARWGGIDPDDYSWEYRDV